MRTWSANQSKTFGGPLRHGNNQALRIRKGKSCKNKPIPVPAGAISRAKISRALLSE